MTPVYITYSEICDHSEEEGVQYGWWTADHTFSVDCATVTCPQHATTYEEIAVDGQVNPLDTIYVLYVTYSTGDSFGCSTGHGEIMYAFADANLATQAHDAIQADLKARCFKFVVDQQGTEIQLSNPGWGYFESIDSVTIKQMMVRG